MFVVKSWLSKPVAVDQDVEIRLEFPVAVLDLEIPLDGFSPDDPSHLANLSCLEYLLGPTFVILFGC